MLKKCDICGGTNSRFRMIYREIVITNVKMPDGSIKKRHSGKCVCCHKCRVKYNLKQRR